MLPNLPFLLLSIFMVQQALAVSETFTLTLSTSEKTLKNAIIFQDGEDIFVGPVSESTLNGTIQDDGSIKLTSDSESHIGVSKNYFKLVNDTTEYAQPFSIDKNGYLKLYGSTKFKAIPSGESEVWILGSPEATSTLSEAYSVKIKAISLTTGKKVAKFSIAGDSGVSQERAPLTLALVMAGILLARFFYL